VGLLHSLQRFPDDVFRLVDEFLHDADLHLLTRAWKVPGVIRRPRRPRRRR
jgi:hypothetical protein